MIKRAIDRVKEILSAPTEELGRVARFSVYQLKLWVLCRKLLNRNRYGQQAAALSYHSIFGIIPLAIVMLMIFQSLPISQDVGQDSSQNLGEQVKMFIYDNMQLSEFKYPSQDNPDEQILLTEHLDELIESFFNKYNKGSVTILSVVIVTWAAMGLLTTIERTFNNIWNIRHGRSLIARIFSYWTPLTLGPLLLGAGIFLTAKLKMDSIGWVNPLIPYLISVFTFFILYWTMPNTKVKPSAALWGSVVAAMIWTIVKVLMSRYITEFIPYSQLYGVLGLIPLTIFWIFITWKIILFGVQLSYTTQNFAKLDAAELRQSTQDDYFIANDETVIGLVNHISCEFENGKSPVTADAICDELKLPHDFTNAILEHLVTEKILYLTTEPCDGFVPATSAANFYVGEILQAISRKELAQTGSGSAHLLKDALEKSKQHLSDYTLKDLQQNSLS